MPRRDVWRLGTAVGRALERGRTSDACGGSAALAVATSSRTATCSGTATPQHASPSGGGPPPPGFSPNPIPASRCHLLTPLHGTANRQLHGHHSHRHAHPHHSQLRGMSGGTSGAVRPASPPPLIAVAGTSEAAGGEGEAEDDPHARMTPKAVVELLDRYIIGQEDAKRAVAVAYRNRWRRKRVPASIRDDIVPKNILLIGPTGCGKTEIARRLAKLADSPFVKVEATKFTEVGYHGRDVDTIVRDLVEAALGLVRARLRRRHEGALRAAVEERLLRALLAAEHHLAPQGPLGAGGGMGPLGQPGGVVGGGVEAVRERLRKGELEEAVIEVDLTPPPGANGRGGGAGGGIIDLGGGGGGGGGFIINLDRLGSGRRDVRVLRVREARPLLEEAEAERMFPAEQLTREAVAAAEQDGIVFIDEIDKIVSGGRGERSWRSGDPSSEGVQRDLLPIIEGSVVSTKHGNVCTDHVLFICAGAFHSAKPSDLMAELQGRLPIRVELKPLTRHDFYRILTEPAYNLIAQQQVLLAAEGVDLHFTPEALTEMTAVAEQLNRSIDNIGARRLHAVLERVVEEVSFTAPDLVAAARKQAAAAAAAGGGEGSLGAGAAAAEQGAAAASGAAGGGAEGAAGPAAVAAPETGAGAAGAAGARAQGQGQSEAGPAVRVRYVIDKAHVQRALEGLLTKQDLSRYIL